MANNTNDLGYPLNTKASDDSMIKVGQPTDSLVVGDIGINSELNKVYNGGVVGSLKNAIGSSIFGINHRQTPGAIPHNRDYHGLTFFTRPDMNLTDGNLRDCRQLGPLLTTEHESIPSAIRCLLDTRIMKNMTESATTQLVDDNQAFIPMLTNHLLSISGWPDMMAPTMTSQEGVYKESFSMVDGIVLNYSTYSVTANFRNIPGDPITSLFHYWLIYASNVAQGVMMPYLDNLINNTIDYQTRIYRLVLDHTKTYVKKIGACGAAFPLSNPIGAAFNYEHGAPINDANHQISIPFQCMGFMVLDDILISEFNQTTGLRNPVLHQEATAIELAIANLGNEYTDDAYNIARVSDRYIKLAPNELSVCNNLGYPHINLHTYELGWYISNDDYATIFNSTNNTNAGNAVYG